MSLTVAFKSAQLGLSQAEKKIAVVSSNINNADRAGYTRKSLASEYVSNGLASLPAGGRVVQSVVNPLLVKQVVAQATYAANQQTMSTYLSTYAQTFGSTANGSNNLQTTIDGLLSTLNILEANSSDGSAKSKVISTAQEVTSTLNGLSQSLQNERLRANNDIASSILEINSNLQTIAELNKQITAADAAGLTTADMEDLRHVALQKVSEQLGVQYFVNPQNQAIVYSSGGSSLVGGSSYAALSYSPAGSVTASTVYPGGFAPIELNGVDITTTLKTGKLGALITLRDTTLPREQEKLDNLANTLQRTVNRVLNQGSPYPPLSTVTGTQIVTSGTAFAGTGNFRVALTDPTGVIQSSTDIDLSTIAPATVGGLITALNGIAGVSASINSSGFLEVTATGAGSRIAMNPLNTAIGTSSATEFFGFNNLFTNAGSGASSITVNEALLGNYDALAVGTLNSGVLVAGSFGVTVGDVSTTRNLIDAMQATQSFTAAGNFAARTSTLAGYAGAIISDVATQAAAAKENTETAIATFTYLSDNLSNETGVNIDEETANLTSLQTTYQANAQIISTIRQLFDTLINAVG